MRELALVQSCGGVSYLAMYYGQFVLSGEGNVCAARGLLPLFALCLVPVVNNGLIDCTTD